MGVRLASSVSVVSGGGGGGGGAEGRVSEAVRERFGEVECGVAVNSSSCSSRLRLRSYVESVGEMSWLAFGVEESWSLGGYCGVFGVASFEFPLEMLLREAFAFLRSSAVLTALLMYSWTQFLILFSWLGNIFAVGSLTGPFL